MVNIFGFELGSKKEEVDDRPIRGFSASYMKNFEYLFNPVSFSQLYDYAMASDAYRTIINILTREIFRSGFEWKPVFVSKCSICGTEYQKKLDECEKCKSNKIIYPNEQAKLSFEKFITKANKNGQSLKEVLESIEPDLEILDNAYIVVLKDYKFDKDGKIVDAKIREILRGDPLVFKKVIDFKGRYGYDSYTMEEVKVCPIHRNKRQKGEKCEICGRRLYPAYFMTTSAVGANIYYIEGEVCHLTKYHKTMFYGYPPALTVIMKVRALLAMDKYLQDAFCGMKSPKGILSIKTTNREAFIKAWNDYVDRIKDNPLEIKPFIIPERPDGTGSSEFNYIDISRSLQELQYIETNREFYEKIGALFGIMPLFSGNVSASGGLNNESQQIVVMGRALEAGQEVINKALKFITLQYGIRDYDLVIKRDETLIETERLNIENKRIQNALMMKQLGFDVDIDTEGNFIYKKVKNELTEPSESEDELIEQALNITKEEISKELKKDTILPQDEAKKKDIELIKRLIFNRTFKGLSVEESNRLRRILLRKIIRNEPLTDIINELKDKIGIDFKQAETIARTEMHEIKNYLRYDVFRQEDKENKNKYKWIGPDDHRTTDICKRITERTKNGVSLEELKKIIKEEADKSIYDANRPFTPHINCRHTFVRVF
ncbi:MAG: phage minor head protein [Candidatus Aenigmatarchaeota archaeon]